MPFTRVYVDVSWCIVGNFNVVRRSHERSWGGLRWYKKDEELKMFMQGAELKDLRYSGSFFTWKNIRVHHSHETRSSHGEYEMDFWLSTLGDLLPHIRLFGSHSL